MELFFWEVATPFRSPSFNLNFLFLTSISTWINNEALFFRREAKAKATTTTTNPDEQATGKQRSHSPLKQNITVAMKTYFLIFVSLIQGKIKTNKTIKKRLSVVVSLKLRKAVFDGDVGAVRRALDNNLSPNAYFKKKSNWLLFKAI